MVKKVWKFFELIGEIRHAYHKRHGYQTWY